MQRHGWTYTNNTWVKDGNILEFTITVDSSNQTRVTASYVIAEQLTNHGIRVSVNEVSTSSFNNCLENKNYEVIITGMTTSYSPKLSTLFIGDNLANYSNEIVTEILSSANSINDYNTLKEQYLKVYDEYLNDFPYIFLYRETDYVIYNQTLKGTINPNSYGIFYNIDKWYRQ